MLCSSRIKRNYAPSPTALRHQLDVFSYVKVGKMRDNTGYRKMSGLLERAKEYVTGKVAEMKKPEATLRDLDLKEVSRECITYDAKVSVINPYSTPIPICEISYTLKSANREIASGTIQDPGSLKGNESTMLDVGVNVPHSVLWSLARDIGADWDIDYDLGINLVIDLPVFGNISIPVSSKGEIKLPTFTDLWTT